MASMTKLEIRSFIRQRKQALLSESRLTLAAGRLLACLQKRADFSSATVVMLYCALPDEVPTLGVLKHWGAQKQLLLPVVEGEEMYVKTFALGEQMRHGTLNILEPQGKVFSALSTIDLILVPGLAFDLRGHRCGRGKGYYDRFLAQPEVQAKTIGVGFDFQCLPDIPTDAHDVVLDDLILV